MSIFGIDLGTTNSLIGLHEKNYLSEIVPSCVDMATGKAGKSQFENMSASRSFKVDISMGREGILPRAASTFVLKELKRVAEKDTGETVKDVVISVPAYFTDTQRTATIAAAEAAELNVVNLVNEPTAAAMYIAQNKKSLFVVYDLGGGTFDCSIIDSRFGNYDVQATSGINIGGDSFDKNIVKNFIKEGHIPIHHLSKLDMAELKHFASKMKIKMQKVQAPFEVDLTPWQGLVYTFTPEVYTALMKMTFGETIRTAMKLIKQFIPDNEVFEVLLVGGSTHCPFLRKYIEESTGMPTAALTYDPDRVVALGAALYADIVREGNIDVQVSDVTKALSIGLYDGTVSNIVPQNSKIPLTVEKVFSNQEASKSLIIDLYQGTSMFRSENECIGTLVWDFEEVKNIHEGQVIVKISIDNSGVITFSANELLKPPKVVVLNRNA